MTLLKLIALEPADLTILSAHLQDAVVKVGDMTFAKPSTRFAALCNRLERAANGALAGSERRRAALRIDRVRNVQVQGFAPSDRGMVLSILALSFTAAADAAAAPSGVLTLVCAGGASLRLDVECVEVVLEDLGPSWQAGAVPHHPSE